MIERRNFKINDAELTTRAATSGDGKKVIVGYAAVFNSESRQITERINGKIVTFFESIDEHAIDNTLFQDVVYLIDHDPSKLIARQSAGNLEIMKNEKGLMFRATLPNTTVANDLYENISVNNMTENSFAFKPKRDEWRNVNGVLHRRILEIERIVDVSTVLIGGYADTVVATRNIDESIITTEVQPEQELVQEDKPDASRELIDIDMEFLRLRSKVF